MCVSCLHLKLVFVSASVTLLSQQLSVNVPDGGEEYKSGETLPIRWSANNIEGKVVIELWYGQIGKCLELSKVLASNQVYY